MRLHKGCLQCDCKDKWNIAKALEFLDSPLPLKPWTLLSEIKLERGVWNASLLESEYHNFRTYFPLWAYGIASVYENVTEIVNHSINANWNKMAQFMVSVSLDFRPPDVLFHEIQKLKRPLAPNFLRRLCVPSDVRDPCHWVNRNSGKGRYLLRTYSAEVKNRKVNYKLAQCTLLSVTQE